MGIAIIKLSMAVTNKTNGIIITVFSPSTPPIEITPIVKSVITI